MSDTRKEFEQWFLSEFSPPDGLINDRNGSYENTYAYECFLSWQACQQINDKRIADLLAVIELQRQALMPLADMAAYFPTDGTFGNRPTTGDIYGCVDKYGEHSITVEHLQSAAKALALTVDDVELVEVGYVGADDNETYGRIDTDLVNYLEKLYTIKQKYE